MSTPRCIRLAIRACKPAKVSNPAARCQRRSIASTQNFRGDKQVDITAGFPQVPASTDEPQPQPKIQQDVGDAASKRNPLSAATPSAPSGLIVELARDPPDQGAAANRNPKSTARPERRPAGIAFDEGRLLHVTFPKPVPMQQVEELFSKYKVRQISRAGGLLNDTSKFSVNMDTSEGAQKAISDLSGGDLSTKPPQPDEVSATTQSEAPDDAPRLPRNVVAAYHKPLRVEPRLGVRVASLQLRSYSVRSLEFMCDFALRAAYFLGLPASGPVPLPKKIERWTMPRSNFVHKKSQENFERITRRRAIQILDGHKDVVQIWLAYLRKHQFYGVGMKADVWEFEGMDVAGNMDRQFQEVEKVLDQKLSMFGWNKQAAGSQSLAEQLRTMGPAQQTGVSMMHVREGSRSESSI